MHFLSHQRTHDDIITSDYVDAKLQSLTMFSECGFTVILIYITDFY